MKNIFKGILIGIIITTLLMGSVFSAQIKTTIEVVYNSVKLTVNGSKVSADNILYQGTTYVPLRAVAEALGKNVGWDQDTFTASINDKSTANGKDIIKRKFDLGDIKFGNLKIYESNLKQAKLAYGEPIKSEFTYIDEDGYYPDVFSFFYKDFTLDFSSFSDEIDEEDYILTDFHLITNKYAGPRGIKVGDNIKDVFMHFPNDDNRINEYSYQELYGTDYDHNANIFYDESKKIEAVSFIYYIDESSAYEMYLQVENDKVIEIWISGM